MELPPDPNLALSNLPFGTCRDEVRRFFPGEPQSFRRTQTDREGDYWADLGVFAHYDDADGLEGVELASPAHPVLSGENLTSLTIQKAKQLLRRFDRTIEDQGNAAISKVLGIALWTGAGDHGIVQAVMRFAPGYYD